MAMATTTANETALPQPHNAATSGMPRAHEAVLAVEGIHCAACTRLIELRVGALAGVESVSASPVTHRVRVRWAEGVADLAQVMGAIARAGYRAWPVAAGNGRAERQRAQRLALWRLFVAGFSMMQVMMYAFPAYLAGPDDIPADIDALLKIASFVLTAPVLVFSAQPFFAAAWRDLAQRRIGMDVPVSIGILVTFGASVWATFITAGPVYYDSVSMFVFLLLGGRHLEAVARARAAGAVEELARQQPARAERLDGWPHSMAVCDIAADALRPGDHVLVRTGTAAPADGIVAAGASLNDEALLTGESRPVIKAKGATVIGGAINLSAPLVLRVTAAGADAQLSTIVRLMERAALDKPALVQLADRYAGVFLWIILALAIGSGAVWWQIEPTAPARAIWVAVAVLIVTCPCALSLAAPVAMSAAIGNLARRGVLVARGHAIETLARANHFVFDKTGTLTTGRMQVQDIVALGHLGNDDLLRLAGRMEESAIHPVAQALAMAAAPLLAGAAGDFSAGRSSPGTTAVAANVSASVSTSRSTSDVLTQIHEVPGRGIEALLDGRRIRLGAIDFAQELHGHPLPPQSAARIAAHTVAALADEQGWLGVFAFGDGVRQGAQAMVAALKAQGCKVTLLTGDNAEIAARVAAAIGIADVRAGASPSAKHTMVAALQRAGAVVAMVGDGVNDAPVLAQAHVSVAMGSGAPLAQTRADMVLMSTRPADLAHAISVAKRTVAIVRQNIAWAATYNLIAIPLAVSGVITPWMAGLGMTMSSLIVVCNSLRLMPRGKVSTSSAAPVVELAALAAA